MSCPGIHLGITRTNTSTEGPDMAIGTVVVEGGNIYEYAQNGSGTVAATGAPAYMMATQGVFGKDADKLGDAIANGAWMAAVPASGYGFILKRGRSATLLGDTATAAGESIYAAADIWGTGAIATHHIAGQAVTEDTASVFTGVINCV